MPSSVDRRGAALSPGDYVYLVFYGTVATVDSINDNIVRVTRPDGTVVAVHDTNLSLEKLSAANLSDSSLGGGGPSPASTVESETSFGVSPAVGTDTEYARQDHTHGTPTDPVPAHVAAGDPHTQYQQESEKDAVSGYAGLDGSGHVIKAVLKLYDGVSTDLTISSIANLGVLLRSGTTIITLPVTDFEFLVNKNTAGGYAGLDGSSKLTGSQQVYGTTANTACQGNDSRLSDSRAPTGSASGDLTGTYPGPTITTDAVTYAKMQNISAASRILGRGSAAGSGDPQELTASGGVEISGTAVQRSALTGDVTASAGSNTTSFRPMAALSVLGNTTGLATNPSDIAASTDSVLRESGGVLGFGTVATGGLANDAVTLAKMANVATDKLLGRDTAGTGDPETLDVSGGLEFTGSGGIQRSALTGDVTASAGSNATTIATAAVTLAKMANLATDRLIGRDTAGTGVPESLTVGGGVEFTGSGGIQRSALTGDVTASAGSNTTAIAANAVVTATIKDANVTMAKLVDGSALSVVGRSANSAGVHADIAASGASDAVLRESGSTIGFGTVATGGIANDAITDAKLRNSGACSVVGRSANSTGDPADISAASDNQFLVRRSSALAFGGLVAGDIPAHASTHAAAAGTDPLKWRDVFYYRGQHFDHDEFTATSLPGWSQATGSGGGAYQTETTYSAQDVDHCGIGRVDTGATSGGYCHLYRSTVSHLLGSGWVFEALVQLRNDNTGFIARLGWGDATGGGDHVDGAYFEYDKATSANWRIVTASNSTRNKQTTSTAVTFSTWIRLKIVWNSATDVQFYVNGTSVGSSTSGTGGTGTWPTASGRDCGVQFFAKNGATSAFSCVDIDYFECYRDVSR